jgi:hypothetical protein
MVGKFLEMGFAPADCARWYPADFVCDKKGNLSIRPDRVSCGHQSLAETGEINVAYGKILAGHPIHVLPSKTVLPSKKVLLSKTILLSKNVSTVVKQPYCQKMWQQLTS